MNTLMQANPRYTGNREMNKKWSEYLQLPELLEYTRKYMLTEEMRELIISHMQIHDGEKILEVGCGTGYLSRYLCKGRKNLFITAVDLDENFLQTADKLARQEEIEAISFLQADAANLPFSENSFDRIVSHTFLTSIKKPERALSEMHRVVKSGGTISSITPMTINPVVLECGNYPMDCKFIKKYRELSEKVWKMYEGVNSITNYIHAPDSGQVPQMFVREGLQEISLFPIGYAFSFSDASFSVNQRKEYIEMSYHEECKKFENYVNLGVWKGFMEREEIDEYRKILEQKRQFLWDHLEDNSIFEWNGRANIMVTGKG